MKKTVFLISALFSSATGLSAAAPLDPRIFAGKAAGETASVLVVMREQADLSDARAIADPAERRRFVFEALRTRAELSQRPLRDRLDAAGARYRAFYLVNMLEVEADRDLAGEMARRPDVSSVAANLPVPLSRPPRVAEAEAAGQALPSPASIEPNVTKIRAPEVWAMGFTGQGIVVGNADTGMAWQHPALLPHYRGWDAATSTASHDYNWHDAIHDARPGNPCGSDSPAPCDDQGHGTSTTSLMVGDDGVGNQVGVAPGAKFIGCRNMDQGSGTPARYTECFEFLMAPTDHTGLNPRPDLGANVINNSWGCPASEGCTDPDVLKSVVENTRAAGILVAVAASNGGPNCATLDVPSYYEASFVVGATTIGDQIANFSSRGPAPADGFNGLKPDVSAPGVGLRAATQPSGYSGGFSGTSGATPMVAGAVALLWSARPELKGQPIETADLLRGSAVQLTSPQDCGAWAGAAVPNAVFGWGRVDVAAAVAGETHPPIVPGGPTRALPAATSRHRPRSTVVAPRS
jgi:serine protease AprX